MKMKKIAAAALAAALALSMTACGEKESTSGTNKPQSGGGTTQTGSNSTDNSVQGDEKEPADESNIWDVLPEIPVTDASAFTYKYDSKLGGMVVTDYLRESPKVRIPDKLEGESVVKVDFSGVRKVITQLVMPDSVQEFKLPSYMYDRYINEDLKALMYINIPHSITKIDKDTFKGFTNLTNIYIPKGVTSIGYSAFSGCTSLTSVTIPNSVIKIDRDAFVDCTSLTSVIIPNSVTEIGNRAFWNCTSLTSATYKGKTYDYEHISDLYGAINGN